MGRREFMQSDRRKEGERVGVLREAAIFELGVGRHYTEAPISSSQTERAPCLCFPHATRQHIRLIGVPLPKMTRTQLRAISKR